MRELTDRVQLNPVRWAFFLAVCAVSTLGSGCIMQGVGDMYSPRRHIEVAAPANAAKSSSSAVLIIVTGVDVTPTFVSKDHVGYNAEFAEALKSSVAKTHLFAIEPSAPARYKLVVEIVTCDFPPTGLGMTASVEIEYTLSDVTTNEVRWKHLFPTSDTKTLSDSPTGGYRAYMALNAAFHKNIAAALAAMAQLDLP